MNPPTRRRATPTPTPTPAPIAVVLVLLPPPPSPDAVAAGADAAAVAPLEVLELDDTSLVEVEAVVGDMLLVEIVLNVDVTELEAPSAGRIQN